MPTRLHFSFDLASRYCAVQGRQQQHGRALDVLEDMDAQDHTRPDFVRCFLLSSIHFRNWRSNFPTLAESCLLHRILFAFARTQLWNN
jgi:hypothetical protein